MDIIKNSVTDQEQPAISAQGENVFVAEEIDLQNVRGDVASDNKGSIISFTPSTSDENKINNQRLTTLERDYSAQLIALITEEHFEYGFENRSDILLKSLMNTNRAVTMQWLNKMSNANHGNPKIIIGILRLIARFDIEEVDPNGATIALAALNHKDMEVRECAIRAFESWESYSSLELLRNTKVEQGWLKEYLDSVINDIEKKYGAAS